MTLKKGGPALFQRAAAGAWPGAAAPNQTVASLIRGRGIPVPHFQAVFNSLSAAWGGENANE
jgi:hypothetical protein